MTVSCGHLIKKCWHPYSFSLWPLQLLSVSSSRILVLWETLSKRNHSNIYVSSEDIFEINQLTLRRTKTRHNLISWKIGDCVPPRFQHFIALACVNILCISTILRLLVASFSSLPQLRHFNFLMRMLRKTCLARAVVTLFSSLLVHGVAWSTPLRCSALSVLQHHYEDDTSRRYWYYTIHCKTRKDSTHSNQHDSSQVSHTDYADGWSRLR